MKVQNSNKIKIGSRIAYKGPCVTNHLNQMKGWDSKGKYIFQVKTVKYYELKVKQKIILSCECERVCTSIYVLGILFL